MPFDFGRFFGSFKGQFETAVGHAPDAVGAFATSLLENAPAKWSATLLSGLTCYVRHHGQQCQTKAVQSCIACAKPVCLGHSAVLADASCLCHICVAKCIKAVRKEMGLPDNGAPEPPAPKQRQKQHKDPEAEKRKRYLDVLGLEDPADAAEIKSQFRELSKKWHPDKAKTEESRIKREAKMKKISEAYHWLINDEERKAA